GAAGLLCFRPSSSRRVWSRQQQRGSREAEVFWMADHGGNDKTGPVFRPRVLLLGLLFCLTRMVILPFPQPTSDVGIYARYVHEYDAARRAGIPFYEFHTRAAQDQIERAQAEGRLVGSREEYKDVEYPPLAVAIMRLPQLLMGGDSGDGPLTPAF